MPQNITSLFFLPSCRNLNFCMSVPKPDSNETELDFCETMNDDLFNLKKKDNRKN